MFVIEVSGKDLKGYYTGEFALVGLAKISCIYSPNIEQAAFFFEKQAEDVKNELQKSNGEEVTYKVIPIDLTTMALQPRSK